MTQAWHGFFPVARQVQLLSVSSSQRAKASDRFGFQVFISPRVMIATFRGYDRCLRRSWKYLVNVISVEVPDHFWSLSICKNYNVIWSYVALRSHIVDTVNHHRHIRPDALCAPVFLTTEANQVKGWIAHAATNQTCSALPVIVLPI